VAAELEVKARLADLFGVANNDLVSSSVLQRSILYDAPGHRLIMHFGTAEGAARALSSFQASMASFVTEGGANRAIIVSRFNGGEQVVARYHSPERRVPPGSTRPSVAGGATCARPPPLSPVAQWLRDEGTVLGDAIVSKFLRKRSRSNA
jgi:hypothetical protein